MRIRFIKIVVLLAFIFSPMVIQADEPEPTSPRWGITTKKNLEKPRDTMLEESESAPATETQVITPTPSTDPSAASPSVNANGAMKIEPTQKPSPDKPASTNKKPTTAATRKKITPQAIDWSSEGQKKACGGYLEDLRSLFLKTRHYSIQGASCDTETSAAAFLDVMGKCQQNCPEGLLAQSGYSERIIRNIKYLEKLGNDRCSGTLTPAPQVTQKP